MTGFIQFIITGRYPNLYYTISTFHSLMPVLVVSTINNCTLRKAIKSIPDNLYVKEHELHQKAMTWHSFNMVQFWLNSLDSYLQRKWQTLQNICWKLPWQETTILTNLISHFPPLKVSSVLMEIDVSEYIIKRSLKAHNNTIQAP